MTTWAAMRRFGVALTLVVVLVSPVTADEPNQTKPTPEQLREIAAKAEKAGDWESAFNAYCHLFVADRNSPDLREKLNRSLRRVQQVRRHRDPAFQQFASGMSKSSSLDLFSEVIQKVSVVYAERERATPQQLWGFAIEELDRALGSPAFRQAFLDHKSTDKLEQFRRTLRSEWRKRTISSHKEARLELGEMIAAAQDSFSIRFPAALAIESACGSCSGLDEFTVFLTPNNPNDQASIPDLTAAGLYLGIDKDNLVIAGIVANSWIALNYPELRRGDTIVKLNGRDMSKAGLAGAADALRSPGKLGHQLEILGEDSPVVIPTTIPSVYNWHMVPDKPVGYIRLGSFQTTTPRELDDAINTLKADGGAEAIILDLRGNHGGSFLAAVETARRLLPSGVIVTTQGQVSEVANQTFTSSSGLGAHDIPLVLMIDTETASAAEVLAAALKENDSRATLVGLPSFGKGTLQYPMRLVTLDDIDPITGKKINKSGSVRVTIAKLIAPTSGPISGIGVNPDVLVADPILQYERAGQEAEKLIEQRRMRGAMQPMQPMP